MELSFSIISHGLGCIAYLALACYIVSRYFRRSTDRALFLACLLSTIWLFTLTAQAIWAEIPFYVRYTFELVRNAGWFLVLYALLGLKISPEQKIDKVRFYLVTVILGLVALLLTSTLSAGIFDLTIISGSTMLILQVAISLVGILLLEQVWRNATTYSRTGIKYLTIAIAALFGYDFFMYSDALLFRELSEPLYETRGAINAIAAPFIALTMVNSRKQPIGIHVSRQMVFHSTTLILAGIYLIFLSVGGYYIVIFGGSWGQAFRVLLIFAGILALVLLLSSPVLRARLMVFISKNFFDYKYDYRDEWIKSTNAFAQRNEDFSLSQQITRVLASIVECQSGAVWYRNEEGHFSFRDKLNLPEQRFDEIDGNSDISDFLSRHDWIINVDEYIQDPTRYNLIEIPENMLSQEAPWLIIPLKNKDRLVGMVLLCKPIANLELNWENYDLLRIVAQQASSYLEQTDSQEKLAEARQFEAVNKTSAFLVHDIKTIIAQLSLLVKNAEKHKSNPAFVEDMIQTTSHTVEKMDHLLQQIRKPSNEESIEKVELGELLLEVYQANRNASPSPVLEAPLDLVWVKADRNELKSAISHIVQNAIDATDKYGEISITTKVGNDSVFIFIQDSGIGMSEDYINNQLFKPFESTKGLTGMGIGVYQSKEYLRKIGGSISVTSEVDVGTCFTLKVPIVA